MRILVIATQLPPFNGSGNIRALNYINYLQRRGHQIDVIGVNYPRDCIAYDPTLENVFDPDINIYRLSSGFLHRFFYTKKTVSVNNHSIQNDRHRKGQKYGKFLVSQFLKKMFLIPDQYLFWIRPALKQAIRLVKQQNYDCLFSMHETPSSHLVAYGLKKRFPRLRWIGYWSDPWNGDSTLRQASPGLKKIIEEKMEAAVVALVDKMLFTTAQTRRFYQLKYHLPVTKTALVYRGYPQAVYQEILAANPRHQLPDLKPDCLNLIHLGTIYKELRDINPLCEALKRLQQAEKKIFEKLNIIFIGIFTDHSYKEKLQQFANVVVRDPLPYQEALKYMLLADGLLLYGNKNSSQVPGKLYEYAGSPAFILTILGDAQDELKKIMLDLDKGPCLVNEATPLYEGLVALVKEFTARQLNPKWQLPAPQYEWQRVIADLEEKIIRSGE